MMANVPDVPGVPPLTSYAVENVALLTADLIGLIGGFDGPQWGVFLDGLPAFDFNSVVKFEFKKDAPVSDYPVEDGGFQSYDKVELPFDIRLRITSGGSEADRQALLESVEEAAASLDLYDVVTPEKIYSSCNITHCDYARSAQNGVGMITIDIWFTEIRVTSTATFTNTKAPSAAGNQNVGTVQPQTPNQPVQQSFADGNWPVQ